MILNIALLLEGAGGLSRQQHCDNSYISPFSFRAIDIGCLDIVIRLKTGVTTMLT